jgi:hypothetical protein
MANSIFRRGEPFAGKSPSVTPKILRAFIRRPEMQQGFCHEKNAGNTAAPGATPVLI